MTIEAAKLGFAFATVRPSATRDPQTRTVNLVFPSRKGSAPTSNASSPR